MSLRWVVKNTIIDDKPGVEARLGACGFEEEQNYNAHNPICSREGIRVIITLTSLKKWTINYIDINNSIAARHGFRTNSSRQFTHKSKYHHNMEAQQVHT